jgi:hypothetical protein
VSGSQQAKRAYVVVVHRLRGVLRALGLLTLLDRWAARSRTGLWVRSWLAVHDLDEMIALDTPWWTFDAADEVAAFLRERPSARVFEWGSGASTVWLGARAGSVVTVEHDAAWSAHIAGSLPANATLLLREPRPSPAPVVGSAKAGHTGLDFADYVSAIDATDGDYDLVVVDGRAREACLERAVGRLRPGGLVVVDNVERRRYRDAIARSGAPVRWTRGRTPALPYPTRTALLSPTAQHGPA